MICKANHREAAERLPYTLAPTFSVVGDDAHIVPQNRTTDRVLVGEGLRALPQNRTANRASSRAKSRDLGTTDVLKSCDPG